MAAGLNPVTDYEVNNAIGTLLRQFTSLREEVLRNQNWLAQADLKAEPYNMSATDESDIKSAIGGLNTSLQAVDMTFINRLTGLF